MSADPERPLRIVVASGKGGTGKTTVAVSLALALEKAQLIDCDVEEPNAHLFLKPKLVEDRAVEIPVPRVVDEACTYCGKCAEVCVYNAIAVLPNKVLIFDELCHGCGACVHLCPEKAMYEVGHPTGVVQHGRAGQIDFWHGVLNLGEPMATPVIRELKKHVREDVPVILDAPPGTSCPVVETARGADFALLVTEPTPFGLHDFQLAVEVFRKLGIPFGAIVNRADRGDGRLQEFCEREGIPILLTIPFDRAIAEGYSKGLPLVAVRPEFGERLRKVYAQARVLAEEATTQVR